MMKLMLAWISSLSVFLLGYSVEGKCESYDSSKAEHSFDGDFAACFFTDPYSGACPHGYTKIKGDFCEAIRGRNKEKQRACCIIQPNFKVKIDGPPSVCLPESKRK